MTENFEDVYDVAKIDKEFENTPEFKETDYNSFYEYEEIINEPQIEFTEEDYKLWYDEQKKIVDIEFNSFEKEKSDTFDDIVKKYSALIGLTGDSYNHATRIIFYSVLANQLKYNKFFMDSKEIDLRLSLLIQLKAGHGKKNYEYFIRRTIESLGKQYQEPTSYHPEQFVGKIIVSETKGEPIYTPLFGTLIADYLVIDEAHALLTRKENEECLRYLRTALDPIGNNRIEKKQVNVPNEEKLMYNPTCTVMLLTQPITNINEDLLMRGSFRRFVVLFIDTLLQERMNARRKSIFLSLKKDIFIKIWESWIEFNKKISGYKDLKYICSDFSRIDDYLDKMGKDAFKTSSEVLEYYTTSQFTIKQNIFKMAIVRAVIEHKEGNAITINKNHIESAISDWHKIWIPQVRWISQQMNIQSMNPLGWDETKHGVIFKILKKNPSISRVDLLLEYCKVSPLTKKVLDNYLTKIIKDLEKWKKVDLGYSGERNTKTVTLRQNNIE